MGSHLTFDGLHIVIHRQILYLPHVDDKALDLPKHGLNLKATLSI